MKKKFTGFKPNEVLIPGAGYGDKVRVKKDDEDFRIVIVNGVQLVFEKVTYRGVYTVYVEWTGRKPVPEIGDMADSFFLKVDVHATGVNAGYMKNYRVCEKPVTKRVNAKMNKFIEEGLCDSLEYIGFLA